MSLYKICKETYIKFRVIQLQHLYINDWYESNQLLLIKLSWKEILENFIRTYLQNILLHT